MLQDLSWLNNCSFAQLEQIRKAIVGLQVNKANDLVDKIRQDVDKNATTIQEIENQITYICKMGLSDTYKNEIGQWRNWQYNINELKKYKINSAIMLDPFRYYVHNCGLDGSSGVKDKLNEWQECFNKIVNEVPRKHYTQHSNYLNRQELKRRLTEWRQENQQRILEIYNMLYDNDCDLHKQMFTNANWNTIYQKFTNAIILSNWSIGSAEILKRDSWKDLDNSQIIDKIKKRTQVMYNLCCGLIKQRQQNSYFGSNHGINNGRSNTNSAYGSPSRNY